MTHETGKLSPKFFFVSLGALVTLITSVSSLLILFFETLNNAYPDALNAMYEYGYNSYNYETIRGAMATLIIVFPIYLVLSHIWKKLSNSKLGTIDEVIRKWMIYLVLFLASIVIVVDLVTLVRYFVSGEITIRFVWKVLGTALIGSMVGIYYLNELKEKKILNGRYFNMGTVLALKGAAIVIALVVWSFCVIGSPKEQRMWRFDDRRVQDLQSIQWQVINFWQQKEALPETLAELSNPISSFMIPVEPEFAEGKIYEYKKTGEMSFELCADFSLPMPEGWREYSNGGGVRPMMGGAMEDSVSSMPYPGGGMNESWDHEAGRTCFSRTIDPDIYPPYEKSVR